MLRNCAQILAALDDINMSIGIFDIVVLRCNVMCQVHGHEEEAG